MSKSILVCEVVLSFLSLARSLITQYVGFHAASVGVFQACRVALIMGKFLPVGTFHTSPSALHAASQY